MAEQLTWEEIKKKYDQEWIELVDYDWPATEPNPKSGVLRSHAADKKKFYRQCKQEPVPKHSAIVFVGPPRLAAGTVFSPSLIRVEPCGK